MFQDNFLDDNTTQAIMNNIIFGSACPEDINIVHTETWSNDEHDSSHTAVVKTKDGKFIRFNFRFNFFMKDCEVMDHTGFVEVKPIEKVVTTKEYVTLDAYDAAKSALNI